jgi:hypothetical protein
MVFIPKEHYQNIEKQNMIAQKVDAKKTLNKINTDAQEPQSKALQQRDVFKLIKAQHRHVNEKPKQVSLKDIEREIKIQELFENRKDDEIEQLLNDEETKEIKNEIIDVLAMTHTHPDKNKIFKYKLSESNTINSYVNDNVLFRFFNKTNSHLKFGTLYAIKYLQTHREYSQYVKNINAIKAQHPEPTKPTEEPKDIKEDE